MITLNDLTNGVHAVYEHLWSPHRYEFLGSSFTVAFDGRTFLVSAGHVVAGKKLNKLRFLDAAGTLKYLFFKGVDLPKSGAMRDDLAILEIDTSRLDLDGHRALGFLPLDRQKGRLFTELPRTAILLTKGYPVERGK